MTTYDKAKEKAMTEWSMPVAEDMLALLYAGVKQEAMNMLKGGKDGY
jgi:hypothetical protein